MVSYDCVVVLGKRPAPGKQPVELLARAALAAAYWHRQSVKGLVFCLEGFDIDGSAYSGSEIVQDLLVREGEVPTEYTLVKGSTNCTSREVEEIKKVLDGCGLQSPLVITHTYHVNRAKKYLHDAGIRAIMAGCSLKSLDLFNDSELDIRLRKYIVDGEPGKTQLFREIIVETILTILHRVDTHGTIERRLSDQIRGNGLQHSPN